MKITELISELALVRDTYGDMDVRVATTGGFFGTNAGDAHSVTLVGIGTEDRITYIGTKPPNKEEQ